MRDFNDKDRTKKSSRIKVDENPGNLTHEKLALLESSVRASLKDGCLPCPVGWRIAKDMEIPRMAVGATLDRLGIRVTNCQLGFFTVDKNAPPKETEQQEPSQEAVASLRELDSAGELKCAKVFELAERLKMTPIRLSDAANTIGLKIRSCQLACF